MFQLCSMGSFKAVFFTALYQLSSKLIIVHTDAAAKLCISKNRQYEKHVKQQLFAVL